MQPNPNKINHIVFNEQGDRALPPSSVNRPFQEYEVLQPIPNVNSGKAASWFDQPGGGAQYHLPMSIDELVRKGFIYPVYD